MGEMIAGNGRVWSSGRRLVDRVRRGLVESGVPAVVFVPVSSRGQDTWFSATGPGFESPYRYTNSSITLFVDAAVLVNGFEIHRVSTLRFLNPTIGGCSRRHGTPARDVRFTLAGDDPGAASISPDGSIAVIR